MNLEYEISYCIAENWDFKGKKILLHWILLRHPVDFKCRKEEARGRWTTQFAEHEHIIDIS